MFFWVYVDLFVKNVDYFYFFIFWFKDKNDEVWFIFNDFNIYVNYKDIDNL